MKGLLVAVALVGVIEAAACYQLIRIIMRRNTERAAALDDARQAHQERRDTKARLIQALARIAEQNEEIAGKQEIFDHGLRDLLREES